MVPDSRPRAKHNYREEHHILDMRCEFSYTRLQNSGAITGTY